MNASTFVVIAILLALFWLIVLRPQRRRQGVQEQMLATLEVGDEIVTAGGLYGTILELRDDDLTAEIAPGTTVRIARRAIAGVIAPDEQEPEASEGDEGEPRP